MNQEYWGSSFSAYNILAFFIVVGQVVFIFRLESYLHRNFLWSPEENTQRKRNHKKEKKCTSISGKISGEQKFVNIYVVGCLSFFLVVNIWRCRVSYISLEWQRSRSQTLVPLPYQPVSLVFPKFSINICPGAAVQLQACHQTKTNNILLSMISCCLQSYPLKV